jgi:DNA primase
VSDHYEQIRSLSFPALAAALGLDISDYKQRKHGQEWYGACPVHRPKQNSTSFSYNQSGAYFCFSCNAKGRGALDLIKAVKACGFKEAVAFLEPFVGKTAQTPAPTEKAPLGGSDEAAEGILKPLERDTWRKFAVPCPWLEARIPDAGIRERYGVFCYNNPARKSAYSGRVMLPVKDSAGVLFGYLGRAIAPETEPKYLFPRNLPKSRFLFGAYELGTFGQLPLKRVFLVESPFCVMKFAMYGLPAVSCFGWHCSPEQIQLLQGLAKGVVYLPDRNKVVESSQVLPALAEHLWLRFPPLPDGCQDPETLTLEQILALTH